MPTIGDNIKDLLIFYVKTHYDNYLKISKLDKIPENKINDVVNKVFSDNKEHIKLFIIDSLKKILKEDEYPGDTTINNILRELLSDEDICKNRIIIEIKLYQNKSKEN